MKLQNYVLVGLLLGCGSTFAQTDSTTVKPFAWDLSYTGDWVNNLSGGMRTGSRYLGLAMGGITVSSEGLDWWKGTELRVSLGNTHGGEPTADLIGDLQGADNIEAGNHVFLYECWLSHRVGNWNFSLGLQDLNVRFAASDFAGYFVNSSFGIHSTISVNTTCAIYPLTALGLGFSYNFSEKTSLSLSLFDGVPEDFELSPYHTEIQINDDQGYFLCSELKLEPELFAGLATRFKLGAYFVNQRENEEPIHTVGAYAVIDQPIGAETEAGQSGLFVQLGYNPSDNTEHAFYCGVGSYLQGFWNSRPNDELGLALAYANLDQAVSNYELAIELAYTLRFNHFSVKPDLQYIISPSGTDVPLDNALVGMIRFVVEL